MQFMPSTFAGYAVDGNGDGVTDIWSPADSIYTAARYLCANGAGTASKLYTAIWHYNHADWYVQMVLGVAADLRVKYPL
jgi:membrane-bound lytic murein transglycosylase B